MLFAKNKMASELAIAKMNILEIHTMAVGQNAYLIQTVLLTSLASTKNAKTFAPEVAVKTLIVKLRITMLFARVSINTQAMPTQIVTSSVMKVRFLLQTLLLT
jgi:hypothetical protein